MPDWAGCLIGRFDPRVGALRLAEDDAERLANAHQVGQSRLAIATKATDLSALPTPIRPNRHVDQRGRLFVSEAPQAKQIEDCPEHRSRLFVCDGRRREFPGGGIDRWQRRYLFRHMALRLKFGAKLQICLRP
jgi:hypothetical protein